MALTDFYSDVYYLDKKSTPDGLGGFDVVYTEGVSFKGVVTTENSIQVRLAEQQGVKSTYTLTTNKGIELSYGDLIKNNNKIYKVVSNKNEVQTPSFSQLDVQQYELVRYVV